MTTLCFHRFIKSDDSQESILKVSVGNVTESSELIHEFGMKQSFFLQYIQPFYAQEEGMHVILVFCIAEHIM